MKLRKLNSLRLLSISVFLILISVVASCGKDEDTAETAHAFIGGQIINPTSDHLVFILNGDILDSIELNENNRFTYLMDSVRQGLYTIQHRPESQNIFISPGDSLLFRVNTLAFDESLHFSGKGSESNNFLAEMFLLDEKNSDLLLSFYQTSPEEFAQKTDSIKRQRLQMLKAFQEKTEIPNQFRRLAKKTIQYENFDLKERYAYLVDKYYKEFSDDFPKDFFDYRKKVRFSDKSMQGSPTYNRFIENYLINYSLKWCAASALDDQDCYSLSNTENIKARINRAAEIIELPSLRNRFFKKLAIEGIIVAKSRENIVEIIDLLEEKGYPEEELHNLRQLGTIQLAYLPGTSLENVPLLDTEGREINFKEAVSRPTIIFLWSIYSDDHQTDHDIIDEMRKKYPEIDFVGINLDLNELSSWKIAVQKYGYDPKNEFQLNSSGIGKKFFEHFYNKLLFLDKDGKVVIGDAFINSPEFESRILEFLNKI